MKAQVRHFRHFYFIRCLYYNLFSGGRLAAIGSGHMFADKYIDQESNDKFRELIFDFLTGDTSIKFAPSDHDDIDVR